MPVNTRPSWINVIVDGRDSKIGTGPASRSGSLYVELKVRENGEVLHLFDIDCIGSSDKKTVLVKITDKRSGNVIFSEYFTQ